MERQIDHQLEKLKTRILKMCSLVDEQVDLAIRSIEEENIELAKLVIERDEKVDKYDIKIDKICQKIIALNQPVAMDLRIIISAMTINSNLERIGDLAVNIAEMFINIKKRPAFVDRINFSSMTALTREMLRNAIDALIHNDPHLAEKVIKADDVLDNYNLQNRQLLIEIMKEDKENIEPAVALLVISRQMERLGDHATNIAEDVYFIVEAQLIKHKYEKFFFKDDEEDDEDDEKEGPKEVNP